MSWHKLMISSLASIFLMIGCQPANQPPADQTAPAPNQNITQTERVRTTDPTNPQKAYPRRTAEPQVNNRNNMNGNNGTLGDGINGNNGIVNNNNGQANQDVAERLEKLATRVPEVKEATAIVAGNFTVVGLDLDENVDRNRIGTIKYSVAQALRKDPQGKNALVTADTDLVERVQNLGRSIQDGNPVSGLMNELSSIAARIAPQPSNDVPNRAE